MDSWVYVMLKQSFHLLPGQGGLDSVGVPFADIYIDKDELIVSFFNSSQRITSKTSDKSTFLTSSRPISIPNGHLSLMTRKQKLMPDLSFCMLSMKRAIFQSLLI